MLPVPLSRGKNLNCTAAALPLCGLFALLRPEQRLYAGGVKAADREAVERVRGKKAPLMDIGDGSFDLRLTFHNSAQCDRASTVPGTERLDGRTVRVTGPDMATMMRWAVALISLGGIQ